MESLWNVYITYGRKYTFLIVTLKTAPVQDAWPGVIFLNNLGGLFLEFLKKKHYKRGYFKIPFQYFLLPENEINVLPINMFFIN